MILMMMPLVFFQLFQAMPKGHIELRVYVRSTSSEIKVTKATVAKAAAKSSSNTAAAKSKTDFSDHAITLNIMFVIAIAIPEMNSALTTPDFMENQPPNNVNTIVVIHPSPFE